MNTWKTVLVFFLVTGQVLAQDHLALRLNEKGILKILRMAIKHQMKDPKNRSIDIPEDFDELVVKKEKLTSNPVLQIFQELSDLDLGKDLNFYLETSQINIKAEVDEKSIKTKILRSRAKEFDVRFEISLPSIKASIPSISLCEDRDKWVKKCGPGLKTTVKDLNISTKGSPVVLNVVLTVSTKNYKIQATAISADSNLDASSYDRKAPRLDISFSRIRVPEIALTIDDQEFVIDTSRLKDEILARKSFLSSKLLAYLAEIVASDLANKLNVYLSQESVSTKVQIFSRSVPFISNDVLDRRIYDQQDATYVRPPMILAEVRKANRNRPEPDMMDYMMEQIANLIRQAEVDLALKSLTTPRNKDILLSGKVGLVLNNREIKLNNFIGNNKKIPLPELNLNQEPQTDITLVVSEPLANGMLELINPTGLFEEISEKFINEPGFRIRGMNIHLSKNSTLVAVMKAEVNLGKLEGENFKKQVEYLGGSIIEYFNSSPIIRFPIEINLIPIVRTLPNGGVTLDVKVLSPFKNDVLINTYNYPSDLNKVITKVKQGIYEEIKEKMKPSVNKVYPVDLTTFLNQSGVQFLPKSIQFDRESYLIINADIVKIDFESLRPKTEGN